MCFSKTHQKEKAQAHCQFQSFGCCPACIPGRLLPVAMRSGGFQLLTGVKVGTCRDWGEEERDIVTVATVVEIRLSLGSASRCMTNVTPGQIRNISWALMSMID